MAFSISKALIRLCGISILIILSVSMLFACSNKQSEVETLTPEVIETVAPKAEGKVEAKEISLTEPVKYDIQKTISGMSLEEKVGQVFIMSLRYLPDTEAALEMTDTARKRIQDNHLGGVILFSENLQSIPQVTKLINDMQAISRIPLFIAIDEEGGSTSRLNKGSRLHSTHLPTNRLIGQTGDAKYAGMAAGVIAREISSLGFNMDFAPIADVDTNPLNPVIGDRSFGKDPGLVAQMIEAQVKEMQKYNVITVLKHFPGHGDTSKDTHTGAVVVTHDKQRLEKLEFVPFKQGIQAGADGIMTAHIQMPGVIKSSSPATLSKVILTDILRKEMKFEGLIITDALEMKAISRFYSPEEAAVTAFEAGADILLMPHPIEASFKGLLRAVKEGRISEERLNQSVARILNLKLKKCILEGKSNKLNAEEVLGCEEHTAIAKEIQQAAESNSPKLNN